MNNGKHTPGPWRVVPCTLEGAGTLRRDIVSDGAEFSPAYVGGDILEDDAQLIAAAPDMLEALQDLMKMRSECFIPNNGDWWDKKASAAIAKATGIEK